jgi:hypothetical protein
MLNEQEVRHAYKELMDQTEYIYEQLLRYGPLSNPFKWALHGLFDIAIDQDFYGMNEAYKKGTGREHELSEEDFKKLNHRRCQFAGE